MQYELLCKGADNVMLERLLPDESGNKKHARMLTYAYADVCGRMLTYADVC
jgi:hypothetical protein